MAKELPYFKFEPNQWENGNIQILSRYDKGLFIDLCSMYWSRLGDVPLKLAVQKLCDGNASALNLLCDESIITVKDNNIYIKFLDEQLSEFADTSSKNSKSAKTRWDKVNELKALSERNASALITQCKSDAIREEERREEEIKDIKAIPLTLDNDFNLFWNKYNKKIDSKKCKDKFKKLSKIQVETILKVVDSYVAATSDVQYRKNPLTWLNGECWKDVEVNTFLPTKDKPFGKSNQL
jgi:hypothetical protein